ncbi:MAG: hypothetical protein V1804_01210 [Patescibacteria group bacterium]
MIPLIPGKTAAEMVAEVAEGLDFLKYLGEVDSSRLKTGEDICSVLIKGYEMKTTSKKITAEDIPVLRKFEQIVKEANYDLEMIGNFVPQAKTTQSSLSKIILRDPAMPVEEMESCRHFFLTLAVSLGI